MLHAVCTTRGSDSLPYVASPVVDPGICVTGCLRAFAPRQLQRLRAQQTDLQEEVRNSKVDPAEMRERLFKKSKEDNDKLTRLQAALKAIEADNEAQRRVRVWVVWVGCVCG